MGSTEIRPVTIIGAGAAGLATAIFAAEALPSEQRSAITLLEGAKRVGAKILVSGGGRCNVTHVAVHPEDYHGSLPVVIVLVDNHFYGVPSSYLRRRIFSGCEECEEEEHGDSYR